MNTSALVMTTWIVELKLTRFLQRVPSFMSTMLLDCLAITSYLIASFDRNALIGAHFSGFACRPTP